MKSISVLTDEKFQEIYSNEEFRNQVADAHSCADSKGHFLHKKALCYPLEYIVSDEQINTAKEKREADKIEFIRQNVETLIFKGMGSTYSERFPDDVCNHRVRTEFRNIEGHRYFIEFCRGTSDNLQIPHAIDRDLEDLCNEKKYKDQPYNNYAGLELKNRPSLPYTKANLLQVVNQHFKCDFKKIIIDNYTLSGNDGHICNSPGIKNLNTSELLTILSNNNV